MCEVMPTINEGDPLGSQPGSDSDANFEQLMVNMLDERDKLLETLRETRETLSMTQGRLQETVHERDQLQRQINSALPQVKRADQDLGRMPVSIGVEVVGGGPWFLCGGAVGSVRLAHC